MGDKIRNAIIDMLDSGEFERIARYVEDDTEAEHIVFLMDNLRSMELDSVPIIPLIRSIESVAVWQSIAVFLIAEETI